jgi:hypothetical protein
MRAVPGTLTSDTGRSLNTTSLTTGVEGVQRLCKALVSAKYTAAAMESWGEDLVRVHLGRGNALLQRISYRLGIVFPGTLDGN